MSDAARKVHWWRRSFVGRTFHFFVLKEKKREIFLLSKDPGLENPVKATAVVSFSPKQRPRTHWKLIRHSGAVVKRNGHRGMSHFSSKQQFVASGEDSPTRREYLMAES